MYNTFRTLIDRPSSVPYWRVFPLRKSRRRSEYWINSPHTGEWIESPTLSAVLTQGVQPASEKILISLAWTLIQSQISRDRWWPLELISLPSSSLRIVPIYYLFNCPVHPTSRLSLSLRPVTRQATDGYRVPPRAQFADSFPGWLADELPGYLMCLKWPLHLIVAPLHFNC